MPFPESRFRRAGAGLDRLQTLAEWYETLSPAGQAHVDTQCAGISDQEIAERYLAAPEEEATLTGETIAMIDAARESRVIDPEVTKALEEIADDPDEPDDPGE